MSGLTNHIRADYDDQTITIYQAYNKQIAQSAVELQKFMPPIFKTQRMTWIKPSFLWMMYRSGWATKENQERILAIKIKKNGFEWALQNACLSHFNSQRYLSYEHWKTALSNSPVRIQWDPERDILLHPLPYRTIQIGLSGIAVEKYISEWITQIIDITQYCKNVYQLIQEKKTSQAIKMIPAEKEYHLPNEVARQIGSY